MTKKNAIITLTIAFLVFLTLFLLTNPAGASNGNGQEKVTICHNTSSETNPQVEITIAVPALEAHVANHEDGEFDTEGPCPVADTTTTTTLVVDETTTTTVAEETTTTLATTTTVEDATTTTTAAPTTTAAVIETAAPEAPAPVLELEELPYTGADPGMLGGLAALLASSGAYLVRKNRR